MDGITVRQLLNACQKEIKLGNGDKKILISNDDEGNGYHEMFFLFTPINKFTFGGTFDPYIPISSEDAKENYVVLG